MSATFAASSFAAEDRTTDPLELELELDLELEREELELDFDLDEVELGLDLDEQDSESGCRNDSEGFFLPEPSLLIFRRFAFAFGAMPKGNVRLSSLGFVGPFHFRSNAILKENLLPSTSHVGCRVWISSLRLYTVTFT